MNSGTIAARYARALLLLVRERGRGEQVFAQARDLLASGDIPSGLEPDLARLVLLLKKNHREHLLRLVLTDFIRRYCVSEGVCLARLTSAVPSEGLDARMEKLLASATGGRVILETAVDPGLIGGFVLDTGDYRLDASVRTQVERIRAQFIQKNNRLI